MDSLITFSSLTSESVSSPSCFKGHSNGVGWWERKEINRANPKSGRTLKDSNELTPLTHVFVGKEPVRVTKYKPRYTKVFLILTCCNNTSTHKLVAKHILSSPILIRNGSIWQ